MRWVGHVVRLKERRGVYRVLLKTLRESDNLVEPGLDERIIVRWIFRKCDVGYGLDRAGARWEQVAGSCEWGTEHSGSTKCGEFLD